MDGAEAVTVYPPHRYGMVLPGLYRGAYPTLPNFRYLSRLGVTTVISLIPETPTEDLKLFCAISKIKNIHLSVNRGASLNNALSSVLISAIQVILDIRNNNRIYVHCLDGRRIIGFLILIIRRFQGWNPTASFAEFWSYQTTLRPSMNTFEIEKMTKDIIKFVIDITTSIKLLDDRPYPSWLDSKYILPSKFSPQKLPMNEQYDRNLLHVHVRDSVTGIRSRNNTFTPTPMISTNGVIGDTRRDNDDDDDDYDYDDNNHITRLIVPVMMKTLGGGSSRMISKRSSSSLYLLHQRALEIEEGKYAPNNSNVAQDLSIHRSQTQTPILEENMDISNNNPLHKSKNNNTNAHHTHTHTNQMNNTSSSSQHGQESIRRPLLPSNTVTPFSDNISTSSSSSSSLIEYGLSSTLASLSLHGLDIPIPVSTRVMHHLHHPVPSTTSAHHHLFPNKQVYNQSQTMTATTTATTTSNTNTNTNMINKYNRMITDSKYTNNNSSINNNNNNHNNQNSYIPIKKS